MEGDKPERAKFERHPIGTVHIDPGSGAGTGVPRGATCEGRLHLFVAVDRASEIAFVKLVEKAAAKFLREVVEAVPLRIHTVLTDNGVQFDPPGEGRPRLRSHPRPALATRTPSSTARPR